MTIQELLHKRIRPITQAGQAAPALTSAALVGVSPLPAWFFAFEGVLGAAYDICRTWPDAWIVIAALAGFNALVGLSVLGRRRKLLRAMLKNSRTRWIAAGLVGARLGAHLLLGALGTQVTTAAGHLSFAAVMAAATIGLLWVDQRVAFRALGIAADTAPRP